MADRICSCCGQPYTDETGHDYEQCYRDCEKRVGQARHELNDALNCLEMATSRRQAQRDGRLPKPTTEKSK
jgi:hypothetical protein